MNVLNLFSDTSVNRFRAYMSSSLTSFPNLSPKESDDKRITIMELNIFLKQVCKELKIDLYLPQESSNPKSSHDDGLSPNEVYLLDRWRIAESDFIIVNANELSFGVGQEIEIANSIGLPVILFFDNEKEKAGEVSRMLRGAPCIFVPPGFTSENSFIVYEKDNNDGLSTQLKDRINILKDFIKPAKYYRSKDPFGKKIKTIRKRLKLSHKELSNLTGLSISFFELLEKENADLERLVKSKKLNDQNILPIDPDKFTNPGLWLIETLRKGLNVDIAELIPTLPETSGFFHVKEYLDICKELNISTSELIELNTNIGFELRSKAAYNRERTIDDLEKIVTKEINNIRNNL